MRRMTMTRELARAAGTDAGNRRMRADNRKGWNADDYNAAVAEFDRLWPVERELAEAARAVTVLRRESDGAVVVGPRGFALLEAALAKA